MLGRMLLTIEDEKSFPNPDKDPSAWNACIERANYLRRHIADIREMYFGMGPVPGLSQIQFTPIIVRSIS